MKIGNYSGLALSLVAAPLVDFVLERIIKKCLSTFQYFSSLDKEMKQFYQHMVPIPLTGAVLGLIPKMGFARSTQRNATIVWILYKLYQQVVRLQDNYKCQKEAEQKESEYMSAGEFIRWIRRVPGLVQQNPDLLPIIREILWDKMNRALPHGGIPFPHSQPEDNTPPDPIASAQSTLADPIERRRIAEETVARAQASGMPTVSVEEMERLLEETSRIHIDRELIALMSNMRQQIAQAFAERFPQVEGAAPRTIAEWLQLMEDDSQPEADVNALKSIIATHMNTLSAEDRTTYVANIQECAPEILIEIPRIIVQHFISSDTPLTVENTPSFLHTHLAQLEALRQQTPAEQLNERNAIAVALSRTQVFNRCLGAALISHAAPQEG